MGFVVQYVLLDGRVLNFGFERSRQAELEQQFTKIRVQNMKKYAQLVDFIALHQDPATHVIVSVKGCGRKGYVTYVCMVRLDGEAETSRGQKS
jgi:hypothetical protein